jgi:signal peptidase I
LKSESLRETQAKRSSSETLIKRSAPDTDRNSAWVNGSKIFPELIANLLTDGNKIKFRAPGDSMYPTIRDGDEITVKPIEAASITIGDIILYRHKSGVVAHRVIRMAKRDVPDFQSSAPKSLPSVLSPRSYFILRGDAAVVFDDPVRADQILGKVTIVEREGRRVDLYSPKAKIRFQIRRLASSLKRFFFEHRFSFPI